MFATAALSCSWMVKSMLKPLWITSGSMVVSPKRTGDAVAVSFDDVYNADFFTLNSSAQRYAAMINLGYRTVLNSLRRLVASGLVKRSARGLYVAA
jgi:hypothetical protein